MSIIQKLRSEKGKVELQSSSEGQRELERLSYIPTLGPRVVNPGLADAVIDIVFIHGLTGDRESTWTTKGAAAPWPELFLCKNLPQARIIMYGYDADVVNFWSMASQNTIGDHSHKFLISFANLRDSTKTSTRPFTFIAYSLGGIVCQDALLKSGGGADRFTQRILEHTRGILFMGTPHCGSGLAEWAVIGGRFFQCFRRVNQQTLEVLQQKSEVMERIRQDFHTMLRKWDQSKERETAIVCFYEELPVRAVGEVVPRHSATLDRYSSIGIHANHMDMTKFVRDQDADYQNILSELRRLVEFVPHQVQEALDLASSQSSETGGKLHEETLSAKDHRQPIRSVNTFSGTFHSGGGKIFQGNQFNSEGGPMNF